MSYEIDHGLSTKKSPQASSSGMRLNPDMSDFMAPRAEIPAGLQGVQHFFQALHQRQVQQHIQNENQVLDNILNELFLESNNNVRGKPPASKEWVRNLPTVESPSADTTCSICLESCTAETKTLMMPTCRHVYHSDCILPWFELHNTCPSCRVEFPTDDEEYERKKREEARQKILQEDSEEEWDPFYG
ncbi:hypothetical protein HDV03_004947 [Kappamyces sp. JEL0829]|nr:hypothetical protein HDV03_004947 [Kappamyces sp. JEL0829]